MTLSHCNQEMRGEHDSDALEDLQGNASSADEGGSDTGDEEADEIWKGSAASGDPSLPGTGAHSAELHAHT